MQRHVSFGPSPSPCAARARENDRRGARASLRRRGRYEGIARVGAPRRQDRRTRWATFKRAAARSIAVVGFGARARRRGRYPAVGGRSPSWDARRCLVSRSLQIVCASPPLGPDTRNTTSAARAARAAARLAELRALAIGPRAAAPAVSSSQTPAPPRRGEGQTCSKTTSSAPRRVDEAGRGGSTSRLRPSGVRRRAAGACRARARTRAVGGGRSFAASTLRRSFSRAERLEARAGAPPQGRRAASRRAVCSPRRPSSSSSGTPQRRHRARAAARTPRVAAGSADRLPAHRRGRAPVTIATATDRRARRRSASGARRCAAARRAGARRPDPPPPRAGARRASGARAGARARSPPRRPRARGRPRRARARVVGERRVDRALDVGAQALERRARERRARRVARVLPQRSGCVPQRGARAARGSCRVGALAQRELAVARRRRRPGGGPAVVAPRAARARRPPRRRPPRRRPSPRRRRRALRRGGARAAPAASAAAAGAWRRRRGARARAARADRSCFAALTRSVADRRKRAPGSSEGLYPMRATAPCHGPFWILYATLWLRAGRQAASVVSGESESGGERRADAAVGARLQRVAEPVLRVGEARLELLARPDLGPPRVERARLGGRRVHLAPRSRRAACGRARDRARRSARPRRAERCGWRARARARAHETE